MAALMFRSSLQSFCSQQDPQPSRWLKIRFPAVTEDVKKVSLLVRRRAVRIWLGRQSLVSMIEVGSYRGRQ